MVNLQLQLASITVQTMTLEGNLILKDLKIKILCVFNVAPKVSYFVVKHSNFRNLEVDKIIVHEDYCTDHQVGHDIALLKLKEQVDLSRHTPACLPPRDAKAADYIGKTASVYGWGLFKESLPCDSQEHLQPPTSTVLRETTETILSNEKCKQSSGMFPCCPNGTPTECPVCPNCTTSMMGGEYRVRNDMLCGIKPGTGICNGDSGGPFTVEADGKHTLVGISSWSFGCARVSIHILIFCFKMVIHITYGL